MNEPLEEKVLFHYEIPKSTISALPQIESLSR